MDFLTCGVSVEAEDGSRQRAVGLVPADSPGIERRPFWKSHVLAGAESDEVILDDVHVPEDFVFVVEGSDALDPVEVTGYIWFQLALSSTYLGIVSGLVERLLESGKGTPEERGLVVAQVEAYAAAVDGIAYGLEAGEDREPLLARALADAVRPPGGHRGRRHAVRRAPRRHGVHRLAPTWPISCAPRGPWPSTPPAASPRAAPSTNTPAAARSTSPDPRPGRDRPDPPTATGAGTGCAPSAHDTDPAIGGILSMRTKIFAHSRLDALLVLLALVQLAVLVYGVLGVGSVAWGTSLALGLASVFLMCTNFQCVAHNFIHNPFFSSRRLNRAFGVLNSLLIGGPQSLYRIHHLHHHKYNNDAPDPETGTTKDCHVHLAIRPADLARGELLVLRPAGLLPLRLRLPPAGGDRGRGCCPGWSGSRGPGRPADRDGRRSILGGLRALLPAGLVLSGNAAAQAENYLEHYGGHPGQPQDRFGEQLRQALQPDLVQQRLPPGAPLPAPDPLDPHPRGEGPVAAGIGATGGPRGPLVQLRRPTRVHPRSTSAVRPESRPATTGYTAG